MKNKLSFISIFTLCIALSLTACGVKQASTTDSKNTQTEAGSEASGKSDSRLDDLYQQEKSAFCRSRCCVEQGIWHDEQK